MKFVEGFFRTDNTITLGRDTSLQLGFPLPTCTVVLREGLVGALFVHYVNLMVKLDVKVKIEILLRAGGKRQKKPVIFCFKNGAN